MRLFALLALTLCACASRVRAAPETRVACAGPHHLADTANGRLQGVATDSDSKAPVAGIQVSVSSPGYHRSTITDEEGQWRIPELPEGRYRIVLHRGERVLYSSIVNLCPEDVLNFRTPLVEPRR